VSFDTVSALLICNYIWRCQFFRLVIVMVAHFGNWNQVLCLCLTYCGLESKSAAFCDMRIVIFSLVWNYLRQYVVVLCRVQLMTLSLQCDFPAMSLNRNTTSQSRLLLDLPLSPTAGRAFVPKRRPKYLPISWDFPGSLAARSAGFLSVCWTLFFWQLDSSSDSLTIVKFIIVFIIITVSYRNNIDNNNIDLELNEKYLWAKL